MSDFRVHGPNAPVGPTPVLELTRRGDADETLEAEFGRNDRAAGS